MLRVVHVYVAALILTTIVIITHPPSGSDTPDLQQSGTPLGDYRRDYWSLNCSEGSYLVVDGTRRECETPKGCVSDRDCAYLDINGIPSRRGYCVNQTCSAVCGSISRWPC